MYGMKDPWISFDFMGRRRHQEQELTDEDNPGCVGCRLKSDYGDLWERCWGYGLLSISPRIVLAISTRFQEAAVINFIASNKLLKHITRKNIYAICESYSDL